ncbi:tetratricopeptide repeat protein [Streptomyces sp. SAS_270]|uniref:tetratricopeptide repeat protein n=1 Tax=Streptomyces sp. SAS_270 TaxID=3412748 RepID=UPI00403C68CF
MGAAAALVALAAAAKDYHDRSREPIGAGLARPLGAPPHKLPLLGKYFTGREPQHDQISKRLRPPSNRHGLLRRKQPVPLPHICVMYGTSGAGKSQLAVSHARRQLERHTLTWWLNASRPDTLRTELLELAGHINIPDQANKNVVLTKLWNWLRANPGWLLVFDDARPDDPVVREQLESLRGAGGEVLITTRGPGGWEDFSALPFELRGFSPDEGLEFLQKRTSSADGKDAPELTALGEQLGWLPLALEQAAAHIVKTGVTVQEYLRGLPRKANDEDTFRLAIAEITQTSPAAVDLLRLFAFLASQDIRRVQLVEHGAVVPAPLREVMDDPPAFNREVRLLEAHSLLTRTDEGRIGHFSYGMHPRVQELIREQLDIRGRLAWSQAAARLVEAWFPAEPDQFESRAECERLMPHAEAAIAKLVWLDGKDGALGASQDPEALARLLHRVGVYQETRCEWGRALPLFTQEADLCRIGLGSPLRHATAKLAVARQHYLLASLGDGEAECQEALRLCQAHDGDTDFQLLQAKCQRQLGGIMRERNRFREARKAVRAAVAIYQRQGPEWDTLDRAVAEQEIGMIYRNAGRLPRAEQCYRRALDLVPNRGSQEPSQFVVFRAMIERDLGIVAQDRGDLDTARVKLTHALSVFREYRGNEDFETAQVAKFLADVTRRLGERAHAAARGTRHPLRIRRLRRTERLHLTQAETLLMPVLELHRKRRATEAHKYAACLNKLGSLRLSQGHVDEARRTLEEAVAIYADKYGVRHHYRAKSLTRLGPVLLAAKERTEAELVLREAEGIFKEALGPHHPVLMAVYEHLADCAHDRGGHDEATALRAEAARIRGSLWLM